jgi:hypothetical protein
VDLTRQNVSLIDKVVLINDINARAAERRKSLRVTLVEGKPNN